MSTPKLILACCLASLLLGGLKLSTAQTLNSETEPRARRALSQKMDELNNADWRASLQAVSYPSPTMTYQATLTPALEATARKQLRDKMTELYAQEAIAHKPAEPGPEGSLSVLEDMRRDKIRGIGPAPQHAAAEPASPATPPVAAAPTTTRTLPTKLTELTELYRENKITPREYHQERAKLVPQTN